MVYKAKLIIIILILFNILSGQLFGSVLYNKNSIIITEYDLNIFNKFFYEINKKTINQQQSIKNILLIKNMINKLKKKDANIMKLIDDQIDKNEKVPISQNDIKRDLKRYLIIKNELMNNYYSKQLKKEDISKALKSLGDKNVSLSYDDCLIIDLITKISDIKNFDQKYYDILKAKNKNLRINFKGKDFKVCLDSNFKFEFELSLIKILEENISKELLKLMYD